MAGFIVIAVVATLLTGLAIVRPMLRERESSDGGVGARAGFDAAIHRDQLAEIDRDLERGAVSASEAEGAKAEISRRLLAAAREAAGTRPPGEAPRARSMAATVAALTLVPAVAVGVYVGVGNPGAPDRPFAGRDFALEWGGLAARQDPDAESARPDQRRAEALTPVAAPPSTPNTAGDAGEYARLVARLEERLSDAPDDARGLRLLADGYATLERHAEVWRTLERLIGVVGADKAGADLFARMAEGMILAAGGYVSPQAGRALGAALERDRKNVTARYYVGLALSQNGLVPQAVRVWRDLRAEAPADAPWLPLVDGMLRRAPEFGNREAAHSLGPPSSPGPTREDIDAAAQLSAEDRREMILGMVSRLEERLTADGGSAEDWIRLMESHVRLGGMTDARRVFDLSQGALKGSDAGVVRERALALGVVAQ